MPRNVGPWLLGLISAVVWAGGGSEAMYGEILSPGYPETYPPDSNQTWTIQVPLGFRVKLIFTFLEMEPSQSCRYDQVKVTSADKLLGIFCGTKNSVVGNFPGENPIFSQSRTMTLEFKSDFSNEGSFRGFRAHYQAVDVDECSNSEQKCEQMCHNTIGSHVCSCRYGYTLQEDQRTCKVLCDRVFRTVRGEFSSPEYPDPYPGPLHCNYSVRVQEGLTVTLDFKPLFEVEFHPEVECPYDQLYVQHGDRTLGPFCGNGTPPRMATDANSVDVIFAADDSGRSRGWSVVYSTERIKCPIVRAIENGKFEPHQIDYKYLDAISLKCDTGYRIEKNGRELKAFSAVCLGTGKWDKQSFPTCQIIDCGPPKELENGKVCDLSGNAITTKYLSKIKYSCDEFYSMTSEDDTFTCNVTRRWENELSDGSRLRCTPVCGKPKRSLVEQVGRIFGGKKAPEGTIPWQVYVKPKSSRAGGILITDQWVLSAAHIFHPKGVPRSTPLDLDSYTIFMGENDLMDLRNGSNLPIEAIHVHPGFTSESHNYDNDIALVKLREKVKLSQHILPVCLPPADLPRLYEAQRLAYVSGWGVTNGDYLYSYLQFVGLPLANQSVCKSSFVGKRMPGGQSPVLTDNMVCAGDGTGQADSCQGDSGGPLTKWDSETGRWYAVGIVSWGLGCAQRDSYGVYTRVSRYLGWLQDVMGHH
uniref:Vitamin K-dependent protein C n=1 Tax=Callorhinchus milii TaxID=7868 RepID=V9KI64_CALMI